MSLDWELPYFESVIFGDFESGEQKYTMLSGMMELLPRLNDLLTYYNMQNTPMDLVFFADCI